MCIVDVGDRHGICLYYHATNKVSVNGFLKQINSRDFLKITCCEFYRFSHITLHYPNLSPVYILPAHMIWLTRDPP